MMKAAHDGLRHGGAHGVAAKGRIGQA